MPMKEAPEEITTCKLQVLVMPNGEIMCVGKSLGWVTDKNEIGKYLTIEKKGLSNEIIN